MNLSWYGIIILSRSENSETINSTESNTIIIVYKILSRLYSYIRPEFLIVAILVYFFKIQTYIFSCLKIFQSNKLFYI